MKLKYIEINNSNIDLAARVQYKIFPYSAAYIKYLNKPTNTLQIDYLIYLGSKPIGVVGLYELEKYKDDIWLSWFGLLKEYRFKGYGSQILKDIMKMAKKYNKKFLRLYTYEVWNKSAQNFYKKHADLEEYYKNKFDCQYDIKEGICKIFSFSLSGEMPPLWNNKFINLEEDDKLHEESVKLMKKNGLL